MRKFRRRFWIRIAVLVCCIATGLTPLFAWFVSIRAIQPSFNASVMRLYFDASSDWNTHTYYLTKPVHLYNLAYLTAQGVFAGQPDAVFYLGKQKRDGSDPGFYVYADSRADESSDEALTSKTLDMSAYAALGGIPPIGFGGLVSGAFSYRFVGNGVTIADCVVKDSYFDGSATHYAPEVGLFGRIADGAEIGDFNVDNLTVRASAENPGVVTCGLVAGYIDQSSADSVRLEKIGVSGGAIAAATKILSRYALIGNGTTNGLANADQFFGFGKNTGVVNFDQIYDLIRTNGTSGQADTAATYTAADGSGKSYLLVREGFYKVANIYDRFVLRDDAGMPVAASDRGISFAANQVISGTRENGLGVFNLVTNKQAAAQSWIDNYNSFTVRGFNYDGSRKYTRFFYSTAEIGRNNGPFAGGADGVLDTTYRDATGKMLADGVIGAFAPTNGDTAPAAYDPAAAATQAYYYEANFDAAAGSTGIYFNNQNYGYLKGLLENTLIDRNGLPVAYGDPEFGVAAQYVDADGTVRNVSKMQYFFYMQNYNKMYVETLRVGNRTWAANGIYFSLNREANVTVFASSKQSSSNNLMIGIYDAPTVIAYSEDLNQSASERVYGVAKPLRHPMYAMWIPNANSEFYYYPEDGSGVTTATGADGAEVAVTANKIKGELVFAHTFRLPRGTYFVAAPDRTGALLHIAVQGQSDGNMGGDAGFAVDFIAKEQLSEQVGGTDYVYSQTAFYLELKAAVAFQASFVRVKDEAGGTDIVYARVSYAAAEAEFVQVSQVTEFGVIEISTA